MGIRGEIFSTKVHLENRTYFFNVKENRLGDLYLNIVESKNKDTGGFERQSIVLFAEDLQEFLKGFDESLRVLEKTYKEQQRQQRAEKSPGKQMKGEKSHLSSNEGKEYDSHPKSHLRLKKEGTKDKGSSPSSKKGDLATPTSSKAHKRVIQVRPVSPNKE
ncbi:MAG: DUF3276 family protein [Treponemataceae bacterium]|nr:DUF3276 family protein [Treponemataceae bacterium]